MRIVDRFRGKPQPAGDLRVRLGELAGSRRMRIQFAVVIGKQRVRHRIKRPRGRSPGGRLDLHFGGRGVDQRVERDRVGRRLGAQQALDAQPQRRFERVARIGPSMTRTCASRGSKRRIVSSICGTAVRAAPDR